MWFGFGGVGSSAGACVDHCVSAVCVECRCSVAPRRSVADREPYSACSDGRAWVCVLQIATTGLLSTTYVHKVSDKVSLATEFLWNWNSREATASVGCVPCSLLYSAV
jgi:hypothetical protein